MESIELNDNESLVLQTIIQNRKVNKTAIAKITKLSPLSIQRICQRFLKRGLIKQTINPYDNRKKDIEPIMEQIIQEIKTAKDKETTEIPEVKEEKSSRVEIIPIDKPEQPKIAPETTELQQIPATSQDVTALPIKKRSIEELCAGKNFCAAQIEILQLLEKNGGLTKEEIRKKLLESHLPSTTIESYLLDLQTHGVVKRQGGLIALTT